MRKPRVMILMKYLMVDGAIRAISVDENFDFESRGAGAKKLLIDGLGLLEREELALVPGEQQGSGFAGVPYFAVTNTQCVAIPTGGGLQCIAQQSRADGEAGPVLEFESV